MTALPPPSASPATSPEGWYTDPWGLAELRWFDGQGWTGHVAGVPTPTLPLRAGVVGLALVAAVFVVVQPLLAVLSLTDTPVVVLVVAAVAAIYVPMVAVCIWASRRWGTGRWRDDLGLHGHRIDLAWAMAALFGAWGLEIAAVIVLRALHVPIGSNTDLVGEVADQRTLYLSLAAAAVVVAPVVEEMFFRGLLLRSLQSRLAPVASVLVQGMVFGAFHLDPTLGWGNIGLLLVLAGVGVAFGFVAQRVGRLAPTIVAHALFNAVVFVVLLVAPTTS